MARVTSIQRTADGTVVADKKERRASSAETGIGTACADGTTTQGAYVNAPIRGPVLSRETLVRHVPVRASGGVVTSKRGAARRSPRMGVSDRRTIGHFILQLLGAGLLCAWTLHAQAFVPFTGTAVFAGPGTSHTCALVGGSVKCWGDNGGGQLGDGTTTRSLTPIQVSGLTSGVTAVATGNFHTCAIATGGAVKCWGVNTTGQLGDGTVTQRLTPVAVTGLGSGVIAIAAGQNHTCALTSGGAVKCWGANSFGQLGDNTQTQRLTPTSVSGLPSGVIAITAGLTHTCAVTSAGAVKCWGANANGQLGDNSTTQRLTPTSVSGLTAGATVVDAGSSHTCALVSGGVKCWGLNANGQLGDNTQTQRLTPVDVVGLASGVTAIAAGSAHTCARLATTGMQCWGLNQDGELGDSTLVVRRLAPVDVTGLTSGVTAITAGLRHTCAVTGGGAVSCWGDDTLGQLGDNATDLRLTPSLVSGQLTVKAMSAGGLHTCAIVGGGVKCWGANDSGQLGDNSTVQRLAAVDVSGLGSGVAAIATGASHSCALTTGGGVKCWGANGSGQLGDNTTTQRLTPVDVSGLTSGVKAIVAGDTHTCALTNSGGVKCWGLNTTGQLGDNTTTQRNAPVNVVGLASGVIAIEAGAAHTCALTSANGVKCWGWNLYGQLGDSTTSQRQAPVDVSGLTSGVSAIAIGQYHSCALVGAGVKCWGWNDYGQVGDGTSGTPRLSPVNVSGLASGVSGVASGNSHTCALMSASGVKCWGDNTYGQIGDGTVATTRLTPVDVVGVSGASAVVAGGLHNCVRIGGGLACWGSNSNGQLGDNSVTQRPTPTDVTGLVALSLVSGGGTHTCALTAGGGVRCWGGNALGQLGDGTIVYEDAPITPSGITGGATAVAAGNNHSCVVIAGGGKCWGDNSRGQLGDGTQFQRLTPVDVSGLSGATAIAASVGGDFTCALAGGGAAVCWGNNNGGQLGDNSIVQRQTPVSVSGLSSGVAAIAAGQVHSCALAGGGVKCWGLNANGQLGDGTQTQRLTPVDVSGLTSGVSGITTGLTHSCAVTSAGGAKCWGLNFNGQLGDGTATQRLAPVNVSGLSSGVVAITAGLYHTCALTTAGGVKCWGLNTSGQLGDGTTTQRLTPVDVSGLTSGVVAIAAGQNHTCALVTNVGLMCWGENNEGELGDGTMGTRPFPSSVLVVGPATQLAITAVNGGSTVAVGTGFSVVVESRDAGSTAAPVVAGTAVALGLVGPGTIGGTASCTLTAGTKTCTANGVTVDTAQIGALLSANRTSGDALTGGLSMPFDVIATAPGAPTGISAVQNGAGITVTFTPPANNGGAPITSYTVTCNPGSITAVGSASPVTVTGLVSGTPYTCNVRATNSVGTGAVSSPSNTVFYVISPTARLLVADGTSLKQSFGPYPDTKWFAIGVEPGKTYVVEAADVDGDVTANAIGTLDALAPDGVSAPPEASVDCTGGNGPRPPAVDVASDGIRCVIRTELPTAGMQQNKRPVYVKVTRMDPALGGGTQFKIRAREATIYGRWLTAGYDYHVEIQNTTGDAMCVEVARYPASGLTYAPGPGWSGSIASFTLTVPAFGAVKPAPMPNGSLVGTDSEGTLRINACASPTNLITGALHVSTYAFDAVGNRYVYFFTSTANEGKTRSSW